MKVLGRILRLKDQFSLAPLLLTSCDSVALSRRGNYNGGNDSDTGSGPREPHSELLFRINEKQSSGCLGPVTKTCSSACQPSLH